MMLVLCYVIMIVIAFEDAVRNFDNPEKVWIRLCVIGIWTILINQHTILIHLDKKKIP